MVSGPSSESIFDRDQRDGLARLPTLAEPSCLLGAEVPDTPAAIAARSSISSLRGPAVLGCNPLVQCLQGSDQAEAM